ncbi:MAG: hypothetical protein HPPSJP_3520 [Candidatus Hepatoplasma scabrum]|nr:MAG: hypothetical protein HPPSJP_3520 [Candidatus Hepatoplasma sp.]
MESTLAWIGGVFLLFFSAASSIMIFVGVFFAIWGFKYKKDSNINLRKKIHEDIISNFNFFIEYLNNQQKMKESTSDIKLLTHFKTPITKKRYRDRIKKFKKLNFDQKIIFDQFRNYKQIEDDFYIRKNVTFNNFAIKNKIIEEKINDRKENIFILTLLNIALFTESFSFIKITEEKYDKIYKHIYKICM